MLADIYQGMAMPEVVTRIAQQNGRICGMRNNNQTMSIFKPQKKHIGSCVSKATTIRQSSPETLSPRNRRSYKAFGHN